MSPESFCYWLQGFFELTDSKSLSEKQILMIKEHLKLVFEKVTPDNPFDVKKFEKVLKEKIEESDKADKEFEKRYKEAKKWGTQGTICGHGLKYC